MKVGDLVKIKQGSRKGKLAIVSHIECEFTSSKAIRNMVIRVVCGGGDWFGYYRRDLEVICR